MKPTIGRVVIYHFHSQELTENNNSIEAPAIIVRVWSDDMVNLKVLNDGANNSWKTSVHIGTEQGQWSWPVINK
jgi:hypothetical protein